MSDDPRSDLKGTSYELFMLLLSLLAFANLASCSSLALASVAGEVAILIEIAITPVFLFDFLYRLATSPSRRAYVVRRWGWADLIGVVPLLRVVPAPARRQHRPRGAGRGHGADRRRPLREPRVGDVPADGVRGGRRGRVRRDRRVLRRAGRGRRQHRVRGGLDLVGPGHDHDRRLRRPVPGRQRGAHRRGVPPVRGHRPVLGADRLHRQRVPRPGPAAASGACRATDRRPPSSPS